MEVSTVHLNGHCHVGHMCFYPSSVSFYIGSDRQVMLLSHIRSPSAEKSTAIAVKHGQCQETRRCNSTWCQTPHCSTPEHSTQTLRRPELCVHWVYKTDLTGMTFWIDFTHLSMSTSFLFLFPAMLFYVNFSFQNNSWPCAFSVLSVTLVHVTEQ